MQPRKLRNEELEFTGRDGYIYRQNKSLFS